MKLSLLIPLLLLLPALAMAKPLTVCTDASPEGFDVVQYNSLVTTNASADVLMNRLVEFDARAGKVVPGLAERWTVSADGLSYTFTLRRNVAFHATDYFRPGRKLNADDVVQSFERMLKPDHPWHRIAVNGFPHAQSMQLPKLVRAVDRIDDQTVRFTLNEADATFLPMLTMGFASIYSAEYMDKLMAAGKPALLNSQPIGTGPFVFRAYQKDAAVRYVANPDYFGGKPKVERLLFSIVPDATVRLQKLRAGECQIALSPKPQDVAGIRGNPALQALSVPAFMTAFVALNSQHKPLDNPKVRQAINLAFDRTAYLNSVFGGTAVAATQIYPPNTWSYARDVRPWPHDPARARALLAEAGLAKGFETTIWTRPSGSTLNPNPRAGAELLQADLARVGIRASIKVIEWGELIKRGKAGEHDLLFMGWAGDNGDPDNFLTPQFSCAAVTSGTNFARYCSPTLDRQIEAGKRTANVVERTRQYVAAQKWIHDQALWVPLAHPTATVLVRREVGGYRVSPFGRQDFAPVVVR